MLSKAARNLFGDFQSTVQPAASNSGTVSRGWATFNTVVAQLPIIEAERLIRISHLGEGRFGNVHEALLNDSTVAVREEYRQHGSEDSANQAANPILSHISRVMVLNQENFARIIGISPRYGQSSLIVMEYCRGGSLKDHLYNANVQICPNAVLNIITQVARAIQFAHEHNVLLNELKTSNFLFLQRPDLTNNRNVKLKLIDYWYNECKCCQLL